MNSGPGTRMSNFLTSWCVAARVAAAGQCSPPWVHSRSRLNAVSQQADEGESPRIAAEPAIRADQRKLATGQAGADVISSTA